MGGDEGDGWWLIADAIEGDEWEWLVAGKAVPEK
jgi:hypothetical protein